MEMKYWTTGKNRDYEDCILLKGGNKRVLSITHNKNNNIMFMEECDGYFFENYKKEEALELLEELKNYIKNGK